MLDWLQKRIKGLWVRRWLLILGFGLAIALSMIYHFHVGKDWTDILHVALPAMVLYMELYMLRVMSVEERQRDAQIEEFRVFHQKEKEARERVLDDLNRFRISTSREHYRQELARTLRAATETIVFTGVTLLPSSRDKEQGELISLIIEKEKANKDFTQRGLIGERIEALAGALELTQKTKTIIKFRKLQIITRLRFQVCDRTVSVLGVAEGEPTSSEVRPTERAFTIDSAMLGDALAERFDREWNDPESKDVWQYFDEFLKDLQGSTPADKTLLKRESVLRILEADKIDLTAGFLAKHSQRFAALP